MLPRARAARMLMMPPPWREAMFMMRVTRVRYARESADVTRR